MVCVDQHREGAISVQQLQKTKSSEKVNIRVYIYDLLAELTTTYQYQHWMRLVEIYMNYFQQKRIVRIFWKKMIVSKKTNHCSDFLMQIQNMFKQIHSDTDKKITFHIYIYIYIYIHTPPCQQGLKHVNCIHCNRVRTLHLTKKVYFGNDSKLERLQWYFSCHYSQVHSNL